VNALARTAAAFDRALAARDVVAGTMRARAFARALAAARPTTLADAYWIARAAMLPRIEDLAAFNDAFFAAWPDARDDALGALAASLAAVPPRAGARQRVVASAGDEPAANDDAAPFVLAMASAEERLAERDFATLGSAERATMLRLIARLRAGAEARPSRRRRPGARGDRLDLRATARAAARTGGELIRQRKSTRRPRVRPLVFLCDVSGSMVPYAQALLHYARASALARPRVRAFAFATRLTDLTAALRRTISTRDVRDFGGGTRIGAALRAFNGEYAQRGVARGGTVVILSDGWEREDPELVRSEMERLRRLTRRIVWVNPQKKHPAFEPLARGMAAALPYIDALVAGHNLRSLAAVAACIEEAHGTAR
jgi:uncharacterized protein